MKALAVFLAFVASLCLASAQYSYTAIPSSINGPVTKLPNGTYTAHGYYHGALLPVAATSNAASLDGSFIATSYQGGAANLGAIFRFDRTAKTFQTLYSFRDGSPDDGKNPSGGLIRGLSGDNALYGAAYDTIYKINADGTGFTTLKKAVNSLDVLGELTFGPDGKLYGASQTGGSNDYGFVFSLATNGAGYSVLYSFSNTDGSYPSGPFVTVGSNLYGITYAGGPNDWGTVFKIDTSTGSVTSSVANFDAAVTGGGPNTGLIKANNGAIIGTTQFDATTGSGSIWSFNPSNNQITSLKVLPYDSYGGVSYDSASNTIYGTTQAGGDLLFGSIFSYKIDTNTFSTVYSFGSVDNTGNDAVYPYSYEVPLFTVNVDAVTTGTQRVLLGLSANGEKDNGATYRYNIDATYVGGTAAPTTTTTTTTTAAPTTTTTAGPTTTTTPSPQAIQDQCVDWALTYGIRVGVTWGAAANLPAIQQSWRQYGCDAFDAQIIASTTTLAAATAREICVNMSLSTGLVPGVTWGTMTPEQISQYQALDCNRFVDAIWDAINPTTTLPPESNRHAECLAWATQYGILPPFTWGTAPTDVQGKWTRYNCDQYSSEWMPTTTPYPDLAARRAQCIAWGQQYHVVPRVTYGELPADKIPVWERYDCSSFEADFVPTTTTLSPEQKHIDCVFWGTNNKVVKGVTWGTLAPVNQTKWAQYNCDQYAAEIYSILHPVLTDAEKKSRCIVLGVATGAQPGVTWGTLDGDDRAQWNEYNCPQWYYPDIYEAQHPTTAAPTEAQKKATCMALGVASGVIPGSTWGTLVGADQTTWTRLGCDQYYWPDIRDAQLAAIPTTLAPTTEQRKAQCVAWGVQYGTIPGVTWGTLPDGNKGQWVNLNCNEFYNEIVAAQAAAATTTQAPQ